jgi:hypothetical protein
MCKKALGKAGFLSSGLEKLSNLLNMLFSYHLISDFHKVIGYIIAAVIGLLYIIDTLYFTGKKAVND